MKTTLALAFSTVALAATLCAAPAQATSGLYSNCTNFNHRYPHGVGKAHAHDHTSGTPVTSFKHDTGLYNTAMSNNSRLDGDKDGIACEKA